jgi:hypothetical protein
MHVLIRPFAPEMTKKAVLGQQDKIADDSVMGSG